MVVEKVDFPFLREYIVETYMKTLLRIENQHFGPIQCDQGSVWDIDVVNACQHARELMQKELDDYAEKRKALYAALSEKYGKRGTDEDWFLTMDGSVHLTSRGEERRRTHGQEDDD